MVIRWVIFSYPSYLETKYLSQVRSHLRGIKVLVFEGRLWYPLNLRHEENWRVKWKRPHLVEKSF